MNQGSNVTRNKAKPKYLINIQDNNDKQARSLLLFSRSSSICHIWQKNSLLKEQPMFFSTLSIKKTNKREREREWPNSCFEPYAVVQFSDIVPIQRSYEHFFAFTKDEAYFIDLYSKSWILCSFSCKSSCFVFRGNKFLEKDDAYKC